jgi:demethylmenaquinone methyltransferase/2-methoxy-6-polyprenyl-1,4-benzoquinol methylase
MTARECLAGNPRKVLDLCTGTGDLAINIGRIADINTEITGLDYSDGMLAIAQEKAKKKHLNRIRFIRGDAASMPFDDGSIDVVGIAFAFRNLTYKNPDSEVFLREIYRVLSPQGRFIIVETSQPASKIIRIFFYGYLKFVVALLGGWLSGNRSAYKYLAASARNFYSPEQVKDLMLKNGFRNIHHNRLFGGIAGITTGMK